MLIVSLIPEPALYDQIMLSPVNQIKQGCFICWYKSVWLAFDLSLRAKDVQQHICSEACQSSQFQFICLCCRKRSVIWNAVLEVVLIYAYCALQCTPIGHITAYEKRHPTLKQINIFHSPLRVYSYASEHIKKA